MFAKNDKGNVGLASVVFSSQLILICLSIRITSPNLFDLRLGQFCHRVFFSSKPRNPIAFLLMHVGHIVGMSAEKEVVLAQAILIWPNAFSVIAAMKNIHAVWDWAVMKFPRDTVCE